MRQQFPQLRTHSVRELCQSIHVIIRCRGSFAGSRMETCDNIFQLAGVLPLLMLLLPPHLGEFRPCQIVLLLTFGEPGIELTDTMAAIPDDSSGKQYNQDDGGKEDDDRSILPPLPELLIELRLQVDDAGSVAALIEAMIDFIQALTEFCHAPNVTLSVQIGNQLPIGLDGNIGRQRTCESIPLFDSCLRISLRHVDVGEQFLSSVGR